MQAPRHPEAPLPRSVAPPRVSVIIPTRNRPALLGRCLDALHRQTIPGGDYEIVVVDSASNPPASPRHTDREAPCAVYFIRQDGRGAGAARNTGAEHAHAELLLFLDDDVIATPGLLARHLTAHDGERDLVVIGSLTLETVAGAAVPDALLARLATRQERLAQHDPGPFDLLTGHFSIRRDAFRRAGGFDASLPRHEDYEFARRALACGLRVTYCPDARAVELYSRGTDLALRDAYSRGRAQAMLVARGIAPAADFHLQRYFEGPPHARLLRRALWALLAAPPLRAGIAAIAQSPRWNRLAVRLPAVTRPLAAINYWSGVRAAFGSLSGLRRAVLPELLVLGYHIIDDDVDPVAEPYAVSPALFTRQLARLRAAGFSTVTMAQWQEVVAGRVRAPGRPLLITFDDADARSLRTAWPILRAHGYSATIFVPAELVGGWNEWDMRRGAAPRELLGGEELARFAAEGAEIGCHGGSHRSLPGLVGAELERETVAARARLEQLLGRPIEFFALPYGNADRATWQALERAGYRAVCTSRSGVNRAGTDPFRVRRLFVSRRDGDIRFRLRIACARLSSLGNVRFAVRWIRSALRQATGYAGP